MYFILWLQIIVLQYLAYSCNGVFLQSGIASVLLPNAERIIQMLYLSKSTQLEIIPLQVQH